MTEPCIRGCVRLCTCPECSDEPVHEHVPIEAESPSLMCRRCTDRLWERLSTVLEDTLHLDSRIPSDYRLDKGTGHHKVSGSPALVRLDVAALTDNRSNPDVGHMTQYYEENRDEHATRSIPYRVESWAQLLAEELELASPYGTMAQAVSLLQTWWETIVAQPWVDDFYNDMQDIYKLIDRANEVEKPKPVGNCFTCGEAIFARPASTTVRCKCGRRYDGLSLVKLDLQRQRELREGTA